MGGFRARDADRERYVEVIESAYVDGQLGEQDRELRVARALTAETLDELDALTRDLQNQPAAVVVRPAPAPTPATPARAAQTSGTTPTKVIGVAVAALFVLVVLAMASSSQDATGTYGTDAGIAVPWETIDEGGGLVPEPGFRMRAADVRSMIGEYEARFGTLEAHEVVFFPRRVVVQVPVGTRGRRFETWTWNGAWVRTADAAPVEGGRGLVDLGTLVARALVDNVETAEGALRVEQGRFDRAVLSRSGDDPAVVTITVTNTFNESGTLTTTPAGEILGRQPFQR